MDGGFFRVSVLFWLVLGLLLAVSELMRRQFDKNNRWPLLLNVTLTGGLALFGLLSFLIGWLRWP
ncbi:hypothetical protein Dxin01_01924 [Deinococcus xinjiangensis]|uniref:Uncharacterized protein n=1 Tax=Deinococcus xinjiangensis TaxID=457454 RepID=A0ABP9VA89_9DEIO